MAHEGRTCPAIRRKLSSAFQHDRQQPQPIALDLAHENHNLIGQLPLAIGAVARNRQIGEMEVLFRHQDPNRDCPRLVRTMAVAFHV